jgi:hypothetical protein
MPSATACTTRPKLRIEILEEAAGSDSGVAVVIVPRSPLAPHMVETRPEGRYYGRVGTTTARLTGAQVDLLMARRAAIRTDADGALSAAAHFRRGDGRWPEAPGRLVVAVAPLVPAGDVVERAAGDGTATAYLPSLFTGVTGTWEEDEQTLEVVTRVGQWKVGADSFLTDPHPHNDADSQLEVEVSRAGVLVLRAPGAVVRWGSGEHNEPELWCHESRLVTYVRAALTAAGQLLADGGAAATQVRCSVLVDGLHGSGSLKLYEGQRRGQVPYDVDRAVMFEEVYRRHVEVAASALPDETERITRGLLGHLFEALAQGGYPDGFDPLVTSSWRPEDAVDL